jgi:outer membrane protein TolC
MGMINRRKEKNMPFKWIALFVFVFAICFSKQVAAQESMMPEVNYSYLEKLIDTARKYYPQVKIAQKKLEIAKIAVKKSQLEWFNFFSVTLNYSPSGGAASLNQPTLAGFQVGFFVNIAALLQKPYIIKSTKVEYEIAKLSQIDYDMMMAADVKSRYIKYLQSGMQLKIQNRIALEAESIVKETRYKFEKGEVNFETFTKGVIYESDNRKGVIDAEANFLMAKSSLETIVGKKLSEIQ